MHPVRPFEPCAPLLLLHMSCCSDHTPMPVLHTTVHACVDTTTSTWCITMRVMAAACHVVTVVVLLLVFYSCKVPLQRLLLQDLQRALQEGSHHLTAQCCQWGDGVAVLHDQL